MYQHLKRIILISQSLTWRYCTEAQSQRSSRRKRESRLAKFILGNSTYRRRDGLHHWIRLLLTAKTGGTGVHSRHSIYLKGRRVRKSINMLLPHFHGARSMKMRCMRHLEGSAIAPSSEEVFNNNRYMNFYFSHC